MNDSGSKNYIRSKVGDETVLGCNFGYRIQNNHLSDTKSGN